MHTRAHAPAVSPSSVANTSLSISVSGNATKIGNSTETSSSSHETDPTIVSLVSYQSLPELAAPASTTTTASADITATVVHSTNGTIVFNVTGTRLVIGTTTYTVVNGTGIFNQHSMGVHIEATVVNGSTTSHLVLNGEVTGTISGETTGFNVSFNDPQSKLAGSFFLSLDGTLTLS
jgi:hypothetical protein